MVPQNRIVTVTDRNTNISLSVGTQQIHIDMVVHIRLGKATNRTRYANTVLDISLILFEYFGRMDYVGIDTRKRLE